MLLPARTHTLSAGLDILPEWERDAEAVDAEPGIGVLLTSLPDGHAIREVASGGLRVAPTGQELGEARWR